MKILFNIGVDKEQRCEIIQRLQLLKIFIYIIGKQHFNQPKFSLAQILLSK